MIVVAVEVHKQSLTAVAVDEVGNLAEDDERSPSTRTRRGTYRVPPFATVIIIVASEIGVAATAPCPIDDYSDLRPTRHAARGVPLEVDRQQQVGDLRERRLQREIHAGVDAEALCQYDAKDLAWVQAGLAV